MACPDAAGNTGDLRRCLAGSVVFIETPTSLGTGVLLDTGEIVTNAHVVDPFGHVDVTFVGGGREEAVEVVGIIAADDVALLAPIDDVEGGLRLGALPDYGEVAETDVFLVNLE